MDLLTEKYRPNTINGYVFKNEKMKSQILEWINNPDNKKIPIPNLLFGGIQGTGKCLSGEELVEIQVDLDSLTQKQKNILGLN